MCKCELCGAVENLVLGGGNIFDDEFMAICEDCLSGLYMDEFDSPIEQAQTALKNLGLNDKDIYAFSVEGFSVIVEYFNSDRILKKAILVTCADTDDAIDLLCELC